MIGGATVKDELVECAGRDCKEMFRKRASNQLYHNSECCRIETNRKIMEKYYATKDRKAGKPRLCSQCGKTKLSRYNEFDVCNACMLKAEEASKTDIIEFLTSVV